jgi:hypothetical protein
MRTLQSSPEWETFWGMPLPAPAWLVAMTPSLVEVKRKTGSGAAFAPLAIKVAPPPASVVRRRRRSILTASCVWPIASFGAGAALQSPRFGFTWR